MPKSLLVALDESERAMNAVDFVAQSFAPACRVTLFAVMRPADLLCEMDTGALKGYLAAHHPDYCREVDARKEAALRAALEEGRRRLLEAGFAPERVATRLKRMETDIALDIVAESRTGYDLLVLGRRGLSPVKGFFLGSVSQKVLNHAREISILVVQ